MPTVRKNRDHSHWKQNLMAIVLGLLLWAMSGL